MRFVPLGLLLALLLGVPSALAHEVHLHDGTVIEGKVLEDTKAEVVIETTFDGKKTISKTEVARVDTSVPPLREQLQYRGDLAKDDVKALWDLYKWAKKKGFKSELVIVLQRVIELQPKNKRARKLLGHEKVDGEWMSPEEKEAYLAKKHADEMRAKGLVEYKGEWVTPEERDAREKGLIKDGDDWVTKEEYHKRRGEQLIDGEWVRVGEDEGAAYAQKVITDTRLKVAYTWSPHFDIISEVKPKTTERVKEGAEKAFAEMRRVLKPTDDDYPENLDERIQLVLFKKAPQYVRFAKWFNEQEKCEELVPGWVRSVQRQHSFWWTHPRKLVAVYQFPNTDKTFVSNVIHNIGLVLITRYRINFLYPSVWLQEGFAYYLELTTQGYTQSFTLGKGGSGGGAKGPVWLDSKKWKGELKKLVAEGRDPPMKRIARMTHDQFSYVELVKSWSVVDMLIQWDRGKFKAFIDATKERGSTGDPKNEEEALREAYGLDYRKLDSRWREFVQNGFKQP
ncbi:MAG: hypothetical protein QNJ98_10635 [Planctomycetota bacterium]|nr:hypothetical protein [Planctomycetota bacterium]